MQLGVFVDRFRREFAVAADAGGEAARALAERLVAPLESSVRLMLLEALSSAADEITRELAPGSVHLRLRGRDPDFVVALPEPPAPPAPDPPPGGTAPEPPDGGDSPVARINFRPPESLKARIEEAANREGLSVNAWLVRAATAALEPGDQRARRSADRSSATRGSRFTGWVG